MSKHSIHSQLDSMSGREESQTYGRASTSVRKSIRRDLPTNMVFCDEMSDDVFQLSYSGATQFLRKMRIDDCRENVEWLINGLLNTSIDDTFPMENAELSIACNCSYNPMGKSLSQMGVSMDMVCKAPSMPPQRYQQMQRMDGAGRQLTEAQQFMRKCGMPVGDGVGVLFGRNVLELTNALRKGTAGHGEYVGHNDTSNVGGMLGECNVAGSHRLKSTGMGWQE